MPRRKLTARQKRTLDAFEEDLKFLFTIRVPKPPKRTRKKRKARKAGSKMGELALKRDSV